MQNTVRFAMCVLLVLAAGCSKPPAGPPPILPKGPVEEVPSFVNRVWRVTSSPTVSPGSLYAFLSDGTLVVTSPSTKAVLGMWTYKGNILLLIHSGVPLYADIVKLDAMELQIKTKAPANPIEISFRLAEEPMPNDKPVGNPPTN